jgi:hypothetical protein
LSCWFGCGYAANCWWVLKRSPLKPKWLSSWRLCDKCEVLEADFCSWVTGKDQETLTHRLQLWRTNFVLVAASLLFSVLRLSLIKVKK